jgi:hypothetical protein
VILILWWGRGGIAHGFGDMKMRLAHQSYEICVGAARSAGPLSGWRSWYPTLFGRVACA